MATMKITKWMLLLLPAMLFSCSNDDAGLGGQPVAVQFGSGNIAGLKTKTTASGTEWTAGDPIGVFMLRDGQALSASAIAEGADNVQYKANAGGGNTSGFTPVSGTPVYYPQDGSRVDFIAYYPYKSPLAGYTLPIDVSDQSDVSAIDVLYSNNATGYSRTSGTVDLRFGHALSKLNFTLTPGTGSPDLSGATLQISNIATTGTIFLANGTVTATNSGQALTLTGNTNYTVIVVPQLLASAKLIVTLAGNDSYEWPFELYPNWYEGLQYTYQITVSKTGITVTADDITDWEDTGDTPTEGVGRIYYEVGDYYPDPNNASTATGIVFWVDPADGRHGKIVGLQESGHVEWSNFYSNTGAADMDNGRVNMHTIYDRNNAFADYPAFAWVHAMNGGGTTDYYSDDAAAGVWYLPAKAELQHLYCAFNGKSPQIWANTAPFDSDAAAQAAFNAKLTAAGGTGLSDYEYWSSSEGDDDGAWVVDFNDGETNYYNKDNTYSSRCVLAF